MGFAIYEFAQALKQAEQATAAAAAQSEKLSDSLVSLTEKRKALPFEVRAEMSAMVEDVILDALVLPRLSY